MGIMQLYQRRVARIERHFDPDQGLEPVRVGRSGGPHHETEAARRRVDVERVLHEALLTTQKHDIKRRVARRRYYLERK